MKFLKHLYIWGIVSVCAVPLLLSPFARSSASEKRALAPFPSVVQKGEVNRQFFAGVDDWIADHFAGRSWMITANNALKSAVFGSSDEDKVIVGKDGWLYFAETKGDFLGTNALSDRDLLRIGVTLDLIAEYVASKGADFVFAVAPNKNSVYPDKMPSYYRPSSTLGNLDRLTAQMSDRDYYLDLKTPLIAVGADLYHARDSHWNALGARLAYEKLMAAAGKSAPTYADTPYTWETTWAGDLDNMIFPAANIKDKQAVFSFEQTFVYTSRYRSEEDILITTENAEASGNLLCFRDSFGNALLPFLAQNYANATFSREVPYPLSLMEETPFDTVILEIVERNIGKLLQDVPVMAAPSRDLEGKTAIDAVCTVTPSEGMLLVTGTLPSAATRVYLGVQTPDGVVGVEAFPFASVESSLGENAFSAYLPTALDGCEITVYVD